MDKEYERIKASGLSGEALREALTEFELGNMGHFGSKVDLGGYYFVVGNTDRALDYLLRAERLTPKAPRDGETRNYITLMHATLSRIYLAQGEYAKAADYADKAVAADGETGKQYRFLQAHILVARQRNGEALALFDELYQTQRALMGGDEIRAYMYLLATAGRYDDCAAMVDLYFENGPFFPGLGLFASGAYENSGQPNKAICAAFLDYEYRSGYIETDDRDFLNNISKLETQLYLTGALAKSEAAISLLRSLYDDSPLAVSAADNAFFVETYCVLKKKILTRTLNNTEFQRYLQLERYFSRFPSYYWNVWQAAQDCSPDTLANYVTALEKIILLDKNGRYAQSAWEEITRLMGYSKE
jgi:tetratricopeptide (TPR) repeat protein